MVGTRRLNQLIETATERLRLPAAPLTIALSGGADSAALALLVERSGHEVVALYIDHGFEGSPLMEKAAREVAGQIGVELAVERVDVAEGPSVEAKARDARYEALTRASTPVLTAHTQDDLAETVLINLIRGTGPGGLAGIPEHRPPNIFRPLLGVTRSETREMATLAGLHFRDDPMNEDPRLLRNRVRTVVIPGLATLNPQIVESLAHTASTVDRDHAYLDTRVPAFGQGVPASVVATLPRPLSDRLLVRLISANHITPTSDVVSRLRSVALGESDRQDLAGGLVALRRGAVVVIETPG